MFKLNREPALNVPDSQLKHTLCRASPLSTLHVVAHSRVPAGRYGDQQLRQRFAREKSCKKKVPSTKNLWQILMWLLLRSQYRFERFGQRPICHQTMPHQVVVLGGVFLARLVIERFTIDTTGRFEQLLVKEGREWFTGFAPCTDKQRNFLQQ